MIRKQPSGSGEKASFRLGIFFLCLLMVWCLPPKSLFGVTNELRESNGAILGCVFEIESGLPVAHATITARNQDSGFEGRAITASDGTFFISSLASGLYTISAQYEEFQEISISDYPIRLSGRAPAEPVRFDLARIGEIRLRNRASLPIPQPELQPDSRVTAQLDPARVDEIRQRSRASLPIPRPRLQSDSGETETPLEILVRWDANASAPPMIAPALKGFTGTGSFSLIDLKAIAGSAPRQRMPELSPDQILVVVMDEQGSQRDWNLIPDPRIIRAESPGPTGEWTGQTLHREEAEFLVTLPRGLLAAELRFYSPLWTESRYSLELLGTLLLR